MMIARLKSRLGKKMDLSKLGLSISPLFVVGFVMGSSKAIISLPMFGLQTRVSAASGRASPFAGSSILTATASYSYLWSV